MAFGQRGRQAASTGIGIQPGEIRMSGDEPMLETHPSLLVSIRDLSDSEAWSTFAEVYLPLIYGYARARGVQEADAADIAQHVLTRVASAIGRFQYQAERGRFRDWLGVITRNEIARFLRQQASRNGKRASGDHQRLLAELESSDSASAWREDFQLHLFQAALRRTQACFEPRTWEAFERTWLHDEPAPDVARALQWGLENVYVARSRVLKRLRLEVLSLADDPMGMEPSET